MIEIHFMLEKIPGFHFRDDNSFETIIIITMRHPLTNYAMRTTEQITRKWSLSDDGPDFSRKVIIAHFW